MGSHMSERFHNGDHVHCDIRQSERSEKHLDSKGVGLVFFSKKTLITQ